ncbi:MAG: alpha/beta fold hydrolase [Actinomycetota bacterium]
MTPETAWASSTDGTRIAVHDFGGDGAALMICHATGMHANCYRPLLPVLTRSHRVFAVDLRGHGASQIDPDAEFSWHDFAADYLAAVDLVTDGSREPILSFGHSMGGCTILLAEAARPGTVAQAWIYEPIVFPPEVQPRKSAMADNASRRRSVFGSRAEALERYAARPPMSRLRADALASYVEHGFVDQPDGTVRLACRPQHEAMTFAGAKIPIAEVATVTIPVAVGKGYTADMPSAADFAEGVARGLPGGELVNYSDLGHFGPLEAPDRIAADVGRWFA